MLRLVRLCGMDMDIMLVERDDSDWIQALRLASLTPEDRLRRHQRIAGQMTALRGAGEAASLAPDLDVAAVLGALWRHDVKFVLIGEMAAVVHGSPFPTEDIDVTPERSRENLARLSDALRDLGAKVRTPDRDDGLPFSHDADSLAGVSVWNLTTEHGDLGISIVPSGTDGYEDLVRGASETQVFGLTVMVASLADIIRSKQAANRPKDQRVLPTLREILASRFRKDGTDQA